MNYPRCPFCGSDNIDPTCSDVEKLTRRRKFYFVYCDTCQACGPTSYDQLEAVMLFNRRLTPEDYDSSREEIQEAQ